ncbi:MAG: transglutaminase domain-containing protein [Bacteroidota bacterium]
MKVYYLIILLIFITLRLHAQKDLTVNIELYEHALNAPSLDIYEITEYFRTASNVDSELIEMSYYWICDNIEYDVELSRKSHLTDEDVSVESTIKSGKAICSGYSKLLCEFAFYLDIECAEINGIGQNYLDPKMDSIEMNHAWNAVLVDSNWKLIDATWGAGGVSGRSNEYVKNLDMRYFFADPEFLLIDHLPQDSTWQMRDNPISYSEFWNEHWSEMRFRKFNNLLDEDKYQRHLEMMKREPIKIDEDGYR